MPFTICQATASDVSSLAKVLDDDDDSELLRLQLGSTEPNETHESTVERINTNMSKPEQLWMIAKDDETGEVMSYAQWVLPDETVLDEEAAAAKASLEREQLVRMLPDGMNIPLILDFREAILNLRKKVCGTRRRYLLSNLGTLTKYRRRGAGSALVCWIYDRADRENAIVALDTKENGQARGMYERLGFVYVDSVALDLRKYGGTTTHVHIGMVREPKTDVTAKKESS